MPLEAALAILDVAGGHLPGRWPRARTYPFPVVPISHHVRIAKWTAYANRTVGALAVLFMVG